MDIEEIIAELNRYTDNKHPDAKLKIVAECIYDFRNKQDFQDRENFETIDEHIEHFKQTPKFKNDLAFEERVKQTIKSQRELNKPLLALTKDIRAHLLLTRQRLEALSSDGALEDYFDYAARQYHLNKGDIKYDEENDRHLWVAGDYEFDEEAPIPYHVALKRFNESTQIILDVAEICMQDLAPIRGRPSDNNNYFIYNLAVMAECLLGLKIKKTNNETDEFFEFVSTCIQIGTGRFGSTINLSRDISPCYEEQGIVQMAYIYKDYGRLDLFVEYVVRTGHQEIALDYFNCEWEEWKKPSNYSLLSQGQ